MEGNNNPYILVQWKKKKSDINFIRMNGCRWASNLSPWDVSVSSMYALFNYGI
jgi:hypothetical protein